MSNQILIKRSATVAKIPLTTDLVLGELAMNSADGKLFMKKNNGTDAIVEIGPVYSVAGRTGSIVLTSADVAEGTNLYYTNARASAAAPVQTVAGRTGAVVLAVADISGAAPLASPALTGTVTAPTALTTDNSTTVATTAFVKAQAYVTSAGASIAAPVQTVAGRNGNVILANADVSGSAPLASPALTGVPIAPTAATADNSTTVATTAFVKAQGYTTTVAASAAAPVQTVAGRTGAVVLTNADVGLANVENKSSVTILAAMTSGNVTTALGFTPVNNATVGAVNGVATLDATGKIPTSQLPALAITDTFVVATQAAMLALAAQVGDVCVRTDTSNTYILKTTDATILANWQVLMTPPDAVLSVNGFTGSVTVTTTNVAEGTNLYYTNARASAAAPVQSVAGRTGAVVLANADVSGSAPLASPALTGVPSAPTAATADNSTTLATTAFVKAQGYTTTVAASAAAPVQSVAGRTGAVVLTIADISGTVDGGAY